MSPRTILKSAVQVVLLAVAAGMPLRAGEGDLDPTWGTGGIGAPFGAFTPYAAAATGAGFVPIVGVDEVDPDELSHWYAEPPGAGGFQTCSGSWIPFGERYEGRTLLEDRDGRLLIAGAVGILGSEATDRAFVARWSDDFCSPLDATFSGSGWELFDDPAFCDTESCRFVDIAESPDASTRYVLLLERSVNLLRADYYLVGLDAGGGLDPGFGAGGYRQVTAGNFGNTIAGRARLGVDELARVYVLHTHSDIDDALDLDVGLSRFTAGGNLDTTFASAGTRFIGIDDEIDEVAYALAIGSDGRVAAAWGNLATTFLEGYVRVYPRGGGTTGAVSTNFVAVDVRALHFDGLGRLTLALDRLDTDGFYVVRMIPSFGSGLAFDASFGNNGSTLADVDAGGGDDETPVDLVVEGGRFYVLVDADGPTSARQTVPVRLEGSLLFADGFEWGSTWHW